MKTIPESPRYSMARKYADHYLLAAGIDEFPFDPYQALEYMGAIIYTYEELEYIYGGSVADIIDAFSGDGFILYEAKSNNYLVAYNANIRVLGRIRWTLAHELGHLILNHLGDFGDLSGLSDAELKILDQEANAFAAELLAPMVVAMSLQPHSSEIYQEAFGLSPEAASTKEGIVHWYKCYLTSTAQSLKNNFADFIDRVNAENNRAV